jgi:signal transduction histidine kinase
MECATMAAVFGPNGEIRRKTTCRLAAKVQSSVEALRKSEERLRLLIATSPDFMFHQDLNLRYTWIANDKDRGIVPGMTDFDVFAETELAEQLTRTKRKVLETGTGIRDETIITGDGEQCCLVAFYEPSRDHTGKVDGLFGHIRNITEQWRMEMRLRRAQRLEAAGTIASQVAHDFNNLLGPMMAYPDLIKAQLPEGHPAAACCDDMFRASQLMAKITENLLALGRRELMQTEPVDLNSIVRQALKQGSPVPASLVVEADLDSKLMPVAGSPAQLSRVIGNLDGNARDAMHDVGRLHIKTENLRLEKPVGSYNRIQQGEYVRLSVSDTGHGIPPNIRDRIFDAFFTTKSADQQRGSGLGLSIVQAIVDDHRGYIDLESRVGIGTEFRVYLPIHWASLPEDRSTD